MTNQFVYLRKEGDKEYSTSFNVNKILYTEEKNDGSLVVVLDDIHERAFETPIINPKTNKPTGAVSRKREIVQTHFTLVGEDIVRFRKLTTI